MLDNSSVAVWKNVVKPYYKYKKTAFNQISKLAISILERFNFFIENPNYPKDLRFTFGNDTLTDLQGVTKFYLNNGRCVLSIIGTKVSLDSSTWVDLTKEEYELFSKNLAILFKAGKDITVSDFLSFPIGFWRVNRDFCEFVSTDGIRYLNKD
jgi:hypothetical protein